MRLREEGLPLRRACACAPPRRREGPSARARLAPRRGSLQPGYGFVGPDEGDGLLPFEWAVERLSRSRDVWVVTTFPDGRPHAMPLWAVWLDGTVQFSTGKDSRKTKNLDRDPRCVVMNEETQEAVVVEGTAARAEMSDAFVDAYRAKYAMDIREM